MKLLLKISSSCFCCFYFFFLIFLFLGNGHILLTQQSLLDNVTISPGGDPPPTFPPTELIPSSTSPLPPMNKTPRLVLLPPNVPKLTSKAGLTTEIYPKVTNVASTFPAMSAVSKKWSVNSPSSNVYKLPPFPPPQLNHGQVDIEQALVQSSGMPPSVNVQQFPKHQKVDTTREDKRRQPYIPIKYQTLPSTLSVQRHEPVSKVTNNKSTIKYGHAGLTMVPKTNKSEDVDVTIVTPASLKNNSSFGSQTIPDFKTKFSTNVSNDEMSTAEEPNVDSSMKQNNGKFDDGEDAADPWSFQSRVMDMQTTPAPRTTGTIQDYHDFLKYRNYSVTNPYKMEAISEPFAGNTYQNASTSNSSADHVTDILNRFRGNFTFAQSNERTSSFVPSTTRPPLSTSFRTGNNMRPSFGDYPSRLMVGGHKVGTSGHNSGASNQNIGHGVTNQGVGGSNVGLSGHNHNYEEEETEAPMFNPNPDQESAADLFMRDFDAKYGKNDKWNDNDLNSSSSDDNRTESGTEAEKPDVEDVSKVSTEKTERKNSETEGDHSSEPTEQPPIKLDGVRIRNQFHGAQEGVKGHDHGGHEHPGHKLSQTVRLSPTEMTKLNSVRINGQGNERPSSTLTSKASANIPAPKTHGHSPPVSRIPVRGHPRYKIPSTAPPNESTNNPEPDPVMIKELPAKSNPEYQAYQRPDQVTFSEQQNYRPQGQRQQHPYHPPQYEQYPRYVIDDSLMQKLTASGSNSDKVDSNQNIEGNEEGKSIGANEALGEAEGGGFGVYPHAPPFHGHGHFPGHPFLPPPPLPSYPGLPVIQTKVTCCKTFYPPPIPPPQVLPLYPPPPGIVPHPYHPVSASFGRPAFHSPPLDSMNEINQGDFGAGNNGDTIGSASGSGTSSSGMVAKADGGSYETSPFLGGIGPVPGYGPHVIPPGYKFGDSYCFHEPILPHPLYLKQVKLNKLLFPFIWKKKLLFNFG